MSRKDAEGVPGHKGYPESAASPVGACAAPWLPSRDARRALEPFPVPVRLREAHLASIDFLLQRRLAIRLATHDQRMAVAAAAAMRIAIVDRG